MGLESLVSGLTDPRDMAMLLQAVVAGVDELPTDTELKDLKDAAANPKDVLLQARANNIRMKYAMATAEATKEQQKFNQEKIISDNLAANNIEAEAIQGQIDGYNDLVAAGAPAQLAYKLVGDAAQLLAFKQAQATDATNGNTDAVDAFIASASRIDELGKEFAALNPAGGAGQKSAFQQTIENLQNQRKEIKNNIVAYAKLRKSGFSVSQALELSADSATAAALASQKFGSQNYNNLIRQIKAVKKAQDELLRSTPQGMTQLFNEAFDKVSAYFDSQEALLRAQTDAATATNRALIENLEAQIEGYERQIGAFQRDLDEIAEKEDEINKAYDEKVKALETVKKLNQDIINQQKSQLSIADALSRGDISAAASAMQDARAQNAAAQGDAATNALDAARQAQLNALTANGLTREQIEARIKALKKDIAVIEFGALQNARDAVAAAEKALEKSISALTYRKKTKEQW